MPCLACQTMERLIPWNDSAGTYYAHALCLGRMQVRMIPRRRAAHDFTTTPSFRSMSRCRECLAPDCPAGDSLAHPAQALHAHAGMPSSASAPRSGSFQPPAHGPRPGTRLPALPDTCTDPPRLCMDACYLWLVGCGPQEQLEALRAVRRVAAKRFADPHPLLTHVVIGSSLDDGSARRVDAVSSGNASVQVVCLDWLLDCVRQGCALPCGPYGFRALPGPRGGAGGVATVSRG